MPTFKLPISHPRISPRNALVRMTEEGTSGLLIRSSSGMRLIHYDSALKALAQGKATVGEITQFKPVSAGRVLISRRGLEGPPEGGFALVRTSGSRATILSQNTVSVTRYASSPPAVKCSNSPPKKHYYPPLERDDSDPHQCIMCNGTLP